MLFWRLQIVSPIGTIEGWFGINTDCDDCIGTIMSQTYLNTTIVLEKADPSFGSTGQFGTSGEGVVVEGISTPDGGLTWHIESITVPSMGGAYFPD